GQTAELAYQQRDSIAPNCSLTVHEIAITSIATGETIVLNEHSAPSTAQEVFGIITGQIRGDVLAGMFHTDCNKHRAGKAVSLANREGGLVLQ
ncbi:MAG: hypothetical protein EBZ77_13565, partial [Chitinophagia bacterium]|nr:hypothetical protein [Chitinophagia bacterium]